METPGPDLFQTNPRGVEACRFVGRRERLLPFQTNPRGVEATTTRLKTSRRAVSDEPSWG